MKEFTSLTPVSKIQLNHQPGPHSPQPQSVSERPLERPTLVRPQRTSTVLIQNNEANQVKLSWIIRFNSNCKLISGSKVLFTWKSDGSCDSQWCLNAPKCKVVLVLRKVAWADSNNNNNPGVSSHNLA